jgi:hypothetical protein
MALGYAGLEIERLADPQTRPPQDHDQRPQSSTVGSLASRPHDRNDLSIVGGSVG